MRIVAVEAFPVRVPLAAPVTMSNAVVTASRNVLVRVSTDDGHSGWGEGVEAPAMTGETQETILAGVDVLRGVLVGRDPRRRDELWRAMDATVAGHRTAIGALDIALHDLAGRIAEVPVAELLGGPRSARIPVLTLFGSGDTAADLETFRTRYASGHRWFKLKLGIGEPAAEAATLRAVTSQAADVVICADANAGWDEATARRFVDLVADLPVRFLEQPVADRAALVRLADTSPVPICADENADSLEAVAGFGPTAVAGVSLKLIKLGGITGVMRGAATCDALGLAINLAGKVAETSIAAAANVHCAAAIGLVDYGCSPANQGITSDVTETPLEVVDGHAAVPAGPGLGIEVDEDHVRAMAG